MKRFELLGIPEEKVRLDEHLEFLASTVETDYPLDKAEKELTYAIMSKEWIIKDYYLLDDLENCEKYARSIIKDILEYLYGDWREVEQTRRKSRIDKDCKKYGVTEFKGDTFFRIKCSFVEECLLGINLSGLLDDWKTPKRIAEYPDEITYCTPTGGDCMEDIYYCYLLCDFIKNDKIDIENNYYKKLQRGRNKYRKLLAQLLLHITNRDNEQFNHTLNETLKHFKNKVFGKDNYYIAIDASFLIKLAERLGMSPEYKPVFEPYILKFEKEG